MAGEVREDEPKWKKEWREGLFFAGEREMQEWDEQRAKAQRIGEGKVGTELSAEACTFCSQRHAVYVGSVDPKSGDVWASVVFADPSTPESIPQLPIDRDTLHATRILPRIVPQEQELLLPETESELSTVSRHSFAEPLTTLDIAHSPFCDSCGVYPASSSLVNVFQATAYKQLVQCKSDEVVLLKPPNEADPLWKAVSVSGSLISLTFLEFESRRRLRTNGVIGKTVIEGGKGFSVTIAETFTTCPRYIQRRTIDAIHHKPEFPTPVQHGSSNDRLPADLVDFVTAADTFFLATANTESIRGCDVSHRGGRPGFVRVIGNGQQLVWGDYHGKGLFQTLGNVLANPRAGLLFIDFERGHTLQLTGRLEVLWLGRANSLDGCSRLVVFSTTSWLFTPNASPFHWRLLEMSTHHPLLSDTSILKELSAGRPVASDIEKWRAMGEASVRAISLIEVRQESPKVKTFVFRMDKAVTVEPGQYSTFFFDINGFPFIRCWTISSGDVLEPRSTIEISVKLEGKVTHWLHQAALTEIRGKLGGFEGHFTLRASEESRVDKEKPWKVLFLSGGIGITPMMAMLRGIAATQRVSSDASVPRPDVCMLHCERTWDDVPFKSDLEKFSSGTSAIISKLAVALSRETLTTTPDAASWTSIAFGRADANILRHAFPDIAERIVYLCGPNSFMGSMTATLQRLGCPLSAILVENFEY